MCAKRIEPSMKNESFTRYRQRHIRSWQQGWIYGHFSRIWNLGPGVPGRSILSAARAGHPVYPWQSSSLTGAAAKLMELV